MFNNYLKKKINLFQLGGLVTLAFIKLNFGVLMGFCIV